MLRLFVSIRVLFFLSLPVLAHAEAGGNPSAPSTGIKKKVNPGPGVITPRALVLPARTGVGGKVNKAAIEVLLTSGLEDLGVEVVDRQKIGNGCKTESPKMNEARRSYLDLNLEKALGQAESIRKAQLLRHGDLLGCSELAQAELFMVQVLLDLGRGQEARAMSEQILSSQPLKRLDPAKYTPEMQELWTKTLSSRTDASIPKPDSKRLSDVGRQVGVEWVVLGTCDGSFEDGESLKVLVVPVGKEDMSSSHLVSLGSEGHWASSVRDALAKQFPPPPKETALAEQLSLPTKAADQVEDKKKIWYKTWWFWTAVGVVVVGGTAGILGGYYSNQNNDSVNVEYPPPW